MNTEVHNAYEVIKNGGIILYPTDTVWGIGCDATNEEAVKKIYALKQREETKSMIVLMNGERMMYNVFKEIPEVAWQILDLSEKPTTLILDNPRLESSLLPSILRNTSSSKSYIALFLYQDIAPIAITAINEATDINIAIIDKNLSNIRFSGR